MFTRRLGKLLRGSATPFQILAASVLGSLIAFVPGFLQGPALILLLALLLLILNANVGVAVLVAIPAKLVSLALMPLSFEVGRVLLDGPTTDLFRSMINAPVLAYFGFENYATTGGLVTGSIFGLVAGGVVAMIVKGFRRKLAVLEEDSERYQAFTSRRSTKLLTFLFVGGGHGKKSYAELVQRRVGNPIRITGLIVTVGVLAGGYFLQDWLSSPVLTRVVQRKLEQANGATVDLDAVDLDLGAGRLSISGLALADPNALGRDVFRAGSIEADVSASDLLRKRLALDKLVVTHAKNDVERAAPGERVGPEPKPVEPAEEEAETEWRSLEDYVADFEVWKERLGQVRRWLERGARDAADGDAGDVDERQESLEEWLDRRVEKHGYALVQASHLIEDAPTFQIGELVIDGLVSSALEGDPLDVRARHLSTHPHLLGETATIAIRSRSERLRFETDLGPTSAGGGPGRIAFSLLGIDADAVGASLAIDGEPPLRGGTIDVALDGSWGAEGVGFLDLPLRVEIFDTTLSIPGKGSAHVDHFTLPIAVRGPIDDPRIRIDDDELADALAKAGADQLAGEVRRKADEVLGGAQEKVEEKLGDKAKDVLGGLLGGGKKD